MIGIIILVVAIAATIYGSYTDIKIREVPNWLSYSLIASMVLFRLIYYFITRNQMTLVYSFVTGGLFLIFGFMMFFSRQWGGADLKILTAFGIGFGSLIGPFSPAFKGGWPFGLTLFINFLLITAIYSMGYGFVISIGNKKVYADIQNSMRHHEKKIAIIVFLAGCIGTFYDSLFILFPIFSILWLVMRYMKSVEKICLVRTRAWKDVVEFDVPVKNVKYRDKILQGTKDPNGFDLNVLRKCRKLAKEGRIRKKIVVKWGIPMIPVFPITILVSVFFGDITFWLMNILI